MDLAAILLKLPVLQYILSGLGVLVIVGQAYVAITPGKEDDAWFAKLEAMPIVGDVLKFVVAFAPIQRK